MTSFNEQHNAPVPDAHIVNDTMIARRPAPTVHTSALSWVKTRLFSGPINSLITLVLIGVLIMTIVPTINWAIIHAQWSGDTSVSCSLGGAC